ncbi:hypothetical protein HN873_004656, partial [Arachis hypogaea]
MYSYNIKRLTFFLFINFGNYPVNLNCHPCQTPEDDNTEDMEIVESLQFNLE